MLNQGNKILQFVINFKLIRAIEYNRNMKDRIFHRAYKFKLEPTSEQIVILEEWFGARRFVWNKALALVLTRLENKYLVPRYNELNKMLTLWKKTEELSFLKKPPKDIMQFSLIDLDKAINDWFNKNQPNKRKPKFKRKHDSFQSFRLPSTVFKIRNNFIDLPKLKQAVKFRRHRKVKGDIKNVTISFNGSSWFISIMCEVVINKKELKEGKGLDVGVVKFATLSDGNFIEPINFKKQLRKLEHYQKMVSRRTKGSNRWLKAKAKVSKTYRSISNKRYDYLHKESTKLADSKFLIVENLKIKNMSKSAKGTIEEHGKKVKQKSGLNKSILQQAWGIFFEMLEYKLEQNGGKLIKVSPINSSNECSVCHYIDKENRETQSKFVCKSCGHEENADINASKVLLSRGLREYG